MRSWHEISKEILELAKRRKRLDLQGVGKALKLTKEERNIASIILSGMAEKGILKKVGVGRKKGRRRYNIYEVKTTEKKTEKTEMPKIVVYVVVLPRY